MIVEQKIKDNVTEIHVFNRDKNNKKQHKVIKDFKSYFYILKDEEAMIKNPITKIEEGNFKSLFGDELKKVYVQNSMDVYKVRERFYKTFEADIPFTNRYIIDELPEFEDEEYRIQYFDIENDDNIDIEDASKPITVITSYDNYLKKYFIFVFGKDNNYQQKENEKIMYFSSEVDMLNSFIKYIQDTDPDIMTGWFSNGFDWPYIINRMKKLKVDYRKLSPMNEVDIRSKYNDISIKGRICFDLLEGYKKLHSGELENNALETVGQEILGYGKTKFIGTPGKLWRENPNKLIEYNLMDVKLLVDIDKKVKIIEYFQGLQKLVKCNYMDTIYASNIFDNFVLNYCKNNNIVLPTKKKAEREKVKGAIVKEPKVGLHDMVGVIDLKALYPNVMISLNMSPETLDPNGEIDVGNGVKFTNKKEGLIPKLLQYLIDYRDNVKKEMAQVKKEKGLDSIEFKSLYQRQFSLKCVTNAFYGQMLFPRCRLHRPEVGASVTFVARKIILWTIEKMKEYGYDVIYGDTDSAFFKLGDKNKDKVKEDIVKLNKSYEEFSEKFGLDKSTFTIKFEKVYEKLLMIEKAGGGAVKKRYAGLKVWDEGVDVHKVDVVGFDTVRSDNSKFTREIQKEVLGMVLEGKDKEEIKIIVKDKANKFLNGEFDLEYIGLPSAIKKNLNEYPIKRPVIRAAEYSNKYLGTNFGKGNKPKIVWIKSVQNKFPLTDVIAFENGRDIPDGFEIDFKNMLEKGLVKKVERIFEACGWNVDEMIGRVTSKSLMEF